MTTPLTQTTASFNTLKQTARSHADLAAWLQDHPELFPSLPAAYYDQLCVTVDATELFIDTETRSMSQQVEIICSVPDDDTDDTVDPLAMVTSWDLSTQRQELLFTRNLTIELSALEWPYVAADALFEMASLDQLDNEDKATVSNILAMNFPGLSWKTFRSLVASDLAPTDIEPFAAWLFTHRQVAPLAVELPLLEVEHG